MWNATTGEHIATLIGHTNDVRSVAFSPDGNTIATGSYDKTVRLWDAKTAAHKRILKRYTSAVRRVSFSLDGNTIASVYSPQRAGLLDATTGESKREFPQGISVLIFNSEGKLVATGGDDRPVQLWDTITGGLKHTLPEHTAGVSIALSPDGKLVATGGWDTVHLWDTTTGELKHSLPKHTAGISRIAFSPDGNTIASADGRGGAIMGYHHR